MGDENISTINIVISQIRDLDYNGDIIIKLELGDKILGESDKIANTTSSFIAFEFSTKYSVDQTDYNAINIVASTPIVCTIVEQSSQNEIAQCSLELQQFLLGETFMRSCYQLQPYPGSTFEQSPNARKAEMEIEMCSDYPMVGKEDLKSGNLLTFTVEALMSPPGSWHSEGRNFSYVAVCSIPLTDKENNVGMFQHGNFLKPLEDREIHCIRKKWALPGKAAGGAAFIGHKMIGGEKYCDESGELRTCEDFDFRKSSYKNKPRVQWNRERCFYLGREAVERLKNKILATRYLPLEIYRVPLSDKGDTKGINDVSFHGVAYVDVTPLIHPGGARVRGAYRVVGFDICEFYEKTKQSESVLGESKNVEVTPRSPSPSPKDRKKEEKKERKKDKKDKKPSPKSPKSAKREESEPGDVVVEDKKKYEGEQYNKARSYVMIEITLDKPFYPKKNFEDLSLSVSKIIPPRPIYPKKINTSEKAISDYRNKITSIANLLLNEYEKFFKLEEEDNSSCATESKEQTTFEERKQKLLYHLNSSGKYLAYKEQIRHVVVRIVRDRFCRTTMFECGEEFQCFLSELYTLLVDEMHCSLTKFITSDEKPDPIRIAFTEKQLKHFAQEADFVFKHCLAEKYYFERISMDRKNPDYWFDAGCHYMLVEDFHRAGECFKECVALDCKHVNGLMMSGVCHTYRDCMGAAECLFETATVVDPCNIAAWVMLGLFYDHTNNRIMFECSIGKAVQVAFQNPNYAIPCCEGPEEILEPNFEDEDQTPPSTPPGKPSKSKKKGKKAGKKEKVRERVKESVKPLSNPKVSMTLIDSVYVEAIKFLTDANEIIFREKALEKHLSDCHGGFNFSYYLSVSQVDIRKKLYCQGEEAITIAINMCMQVPKAWAILGHLKYLLNDYDDAVCSYERRLSYGVDDEDLHYVYLRLGAAYIYLCKFEEAKQIYLNACKRNPTCLSWLGAGISCYRLSQLKEAEEALMEANFLNNEDAEVWGYLCLVSQHKCRPFEAQQAYKHAVRLGLCNAVLCTEIMEIQQVTGICVT